MTRHAIHLLVPGLLLPPQLAASADSGLHLPALETWLARAQPEPLRAGSLEDWLCAAFGVADHAIAPLTLAAEGVDAGTHYWLRADPVYLDLQREQMILHADIEVAAEDAAALCASLNLHFAEQGLYFIAPHPQRWYLRVPAVPELHTLAPGQFNGRNVRAHLPQGADALHWHAVSNEIQMLFHEHAVNQARSAHGEFPINSVWLWGGGVRADKLAQPYARVYSNSHLVSAIAQAAGSTHAALPQHATQYMQGDEGATLIVWEGLRHALQQGDMHAWRTSLQDLEQHHAAPLLHALRAGHIQRLHLYAPDSARTHGYVLTRAQAWHLWRRRKPLHRHAV